jgi:hypothetical protein
VSGNNPLAMSCPSRLFFFWPNVHDSASQRWRLSAWQFSQRNPTQHTIAFLTLLRFAFLAVCSVRLEALAERDANSFSATVRRLVMAGLRSEQSQRRSGAEDGD